MKPHETAKKLREDSRLIKGDTHRTIKETKRLIKESRRLLSELFKFDSATSSRMEASGAEPASGPMSRDTLCRAALIIIAAAYVLLLSTLANA
jgi:hypothetical protein